MFGVFHVKHLFWILPTEVRLARPRLAGSQPSSPQKQGQDPEGGIWHSAFCCGKCDRVALLRLLAGRTSPDKPTTRPNNRSTPQTAPCPWPQPVTQPPRPAQTAPQTTTRTTCATTTNTNNTNNTNTAQTGPSPSTQPIPSPPITTNTKPTTTTNHLHTTNHDNKNPAHHRNVQMTGCVGGCGAPMGVGFGD